MLKNETGKMMQRKKGDFEMLSMSVLIKSKINLFHNWLYCRFMFI